MTPKNRIKDRIFIFWSAGCSLLRAEGFSCSLSVLYVGLGISKLQFLIKKIKIKFLVVNIFQFQIIKPWIRIRDPDPDPESGSAIRKNAGSGSALNQCGSETLQYLYIPYIYNSSRTASCCLNRFHSVEGLLWGAEPRIELRPALQQVDALWFVPRRTYQFQANGKD